MGKRNQQNYHWKTIDIHIHTPASQDFQQPDVTYIEILQRAEARGLDCVAFTDHNTIAGYRNMRSEIEQLEMLERLNRLLPEEKRKLAEYRRLTGKILVLPGIEFTATFGFHVIGLFDPVKPIREIEHLLLDLKIPPNQLDDGSATVGATTDVLTAYRMMNDAGAIVIAAHANSSNGVAMRGMPFGGQTKIAYTQDVNLHALEVTDLDLKGPRTSAAFFNGTKPEYPRRMHCIQGSDSHRLITDASRKKNPGIGDRATDILVPSLTFESLKELFQSNDFARTRPQRTKEEPAFDFIQAALDEGPSIIQEFHEDMSIRGGKLYSIISDICAFGNTNGGTLFIGVTADAKSAPVGVPESESGINQLEKEISKRISPPIHCSFDVNEFHGKKIIRVLVPRGDDPPYAVDENKIYVRDEAETGLAVRDEIVQLVRRGSDQSPITLTTPAAMSIPSVDTHIEEELLEESPRTGVEVLPPVERDGVDYFAMRDLRNGNTVKNVTRASARRLWHYAINRYTEVAGRVESLVTEWQGVYGILKRHQQGKVAYFDLVCKTKEGYRYFFGVTPNGIHGPWKSLVGDEEV